MSSPLREARKRIRKREEQKGRTLPLAPHERPQESTVPVRYNTVRITVDGSLLYIHEGTLDTDGIEKFQEALNFYEGLLLLNIDEPTAPDEPKE